MKIPLACVMPKEKSELTLDWFSWKGALMWLGSPLLSVLLTQSVDDALTYCTWLNKDDNKVAVFHHENGRLYELFLHRFFYPHNWNILPYLVLAWGTLLYHPFVCQALSHVHP